MAFSHDSSSRITRKRPRPDYNALNNGIVSDVLPWQDEVDPSGSSSLEPLPSAMPTPSNESLSAPHENISSDELSLVPSESASQGLRSPSQNSDDSSQLDQESDFDETPSKRKKRSRTSWTADHFDAIGLETTWCPKGGRHRNDRLLLCKRCKWSSKDSARQGGTTNLATHLYKEHHIKQNTITPPAGPLDMFIEPAKFGLDPMQALLRWVIETQQPFTVVEHPTWKELLKSLNASCPIKTADTLRNRVQSEYSSWRGRLKQDLADTCQSISLSLDIWTSENQISFLAIVGHWLTPDFKLREDLLEFIEIDGLHSGENLSTIVKSVLETFQIEHKLLTITGDNAGNNLTLCDYLHADLSKDFDDEDSPFRMKPLMRFRGRDSFIGCLAHILNLICKDILVFLKAGSLRDAHVILDEMPSQKDHSAEKALSTKGAIVKIRLLALWIGHSPQRRQAWKDISPCKQINYDIDTRWNSTYNMISEALRLRKEVTQFIREHPDIRDMQPTDSDWSTLRQIQKVLKPFWDHTNSVSKRCPSITESLPIYWSLDDILDDIKNNEGDFQEVTEEVQNAVEAGILKMDKFTKKMDSNIIYYVAAVLDPRVKTSFIRAQMSKSDADAIVSDTREYIKKQYPASPASSSSAERPPGMPETLWRKLKKIQPVQSADMISDIDRYLDSSPEMWSHSMIEDGDPDWILKWWKANAFNYPLMSKAVRDYLPIPSAEVGVERLFSNARDVLGIRRHCLNSETLRWLMFLKGQYGKECRDSA